MFWSKNKKNRYTPANPNFAILKWGSRGYTFHGHVFLMICVSYSFSVRRTLTQHLEQLADAESTCARIRNAFVIKLSVVFENLKLERIAQSTGSKRLLHGRSQCVGQFPDSTPHSRSKDGDLGTSFFQHLM